MLNVVRCWILLSTLLVSGGWILSALHQLNRTGYGVVLALLALVVLVWWRKNQPQVSGIARRLQCKFSKRFRRRAPQFFFLIAALSFLSGCLYPALNFDANAYRLPRVMHWLWAGHWHWIHTYDSRMNISACGMEWLSAPLILFSHTDRFLFLINWVSYLMLPGLAFSVFTRLQVRPRVAWWWMWLLSSGYCFALQAGSIANDSFAAIYILAAVDLALRANEKKSVSNLWLSLAAAALATGAKQTNIPLVALWFIAAWPARSLFWKNPLRTVVVAGFGLLVSIVPVSVLNYQHYGTWMPLDPNVIAHLGEFRVNPFWGIVGNLVCIPAQNLLPPFFEVIPPFFDFWPAAWNEMMQHFRHTTFGNHFASFEKFGHLSGSFYHGISEGNAGLGLGLCVMIFAALREIRRHRKCVPHDSAIRHNKLLFLLRTSPWILLLLFMAKVGTFENARHLAPYYAFLFPVFLIKPAQSMVVRHRQWQRLGVVTMGFTVALVIGSGDRPLFPAKTIFASLHEKFPDNEFISAQSGRYLYGPYRNIEARRDYLKNALPPGESKIGYYALFYGADGPGIWLPYGKRTVICISPGDSPEYLRAQDIKYLVINSHVLPGQNFERWLKQFNAALVSRYIHSPSEDITSTTELYLVRLN
jgi:hypothetical protein